jgi:hypothetical protein
MTDEIINKPDPRRKPKLKPATWAEIAEYWETGQYTLKELSARYKISPESISQKMKKMGKVKGARAGEISKEITNVVRQEAVIPARVVAERLRDTREQHYEWSSNLTRMMMHQIAVTVVKDKKPISAIADDIRAYERALNALKVGREERFAALGVREDDSSQTQELQELPIREMTAEEVNFQRRLLTGGDEFDPSNMTEAEINDALGIEDEGDEENALGE